MKPSESKTVRRVLLYFQFFEVDLQIAGGVEAGTFYTGAAHIHALHQSKTEIQANGTAAACRKEGQCNTHYGQKCKAHADV